MCPPPLVEIGLRGHIVLGGDNVPPLVEIGHIFLSFLRHLHITYVSHILEFQQIPPLNSFSFSGSDALFI